MSLFSFFFIVVVVLSGAVVSSPVKRDSKILFDGRIPLSAELKDLDNSSTSPYNTQFVLGAGQKWSDVAIFPRVEPSLFDLQRSKPIEVTINDKSIFVPGGGAPQTGFRRSQLIPSTNNGTDATVNGDTTFHFSIMQDNSRPLNYSHQYDLVFIETSDFSSHVWTLKTGTPYGSSDVSATNARKLVLGGSTAAGVATEKALFSVPFDKSWHNFAIETSWSKNTIAVYYSAGCEPLQQVVNATANNSVGKGQAHVGVLKYPTDAGPSSDVAHQGFQEPNLNEGIIYGGVFIEDSSGGKVTCKP